MNGAAVAALAALLAAIGGVLAVAAHRRNVAAAFNAAVSLAVAGVAVGAAAGFQPGQHGLLAPELALWTALAGLLHSIGMLGPYDTVWWWDHLTHALSAALLAALVYAGFLVTLGNAQSTTVVAAATVAYTVAAGVFWELGELVARAVGERYDVEPVLVYYGWRDTADDLVFDALGAVAVVALDARLFVSLVAQYPETTRRLLRWSSAFVLVGSVAMALLLLGRRARRST